MSSSSEAQEPVQERLKDQVSLSIKEALDKANTVLTNLHRVQSYLDVIRILSTTRSSDVIKNALEQIHEARNDTATLLQHIYLTEIGLQSLQDYGNGGGLMGVSSGGGATTTSSSAAAAANPLSSLMPILGDTINSSGVPSAVTVIDSVHDSIMDGLDTQELDFTSSTTNETEGQPPTKKVKQDIVVSTCVSCSRKFATLTSSSYVNLCRNCRTSGTALMVASQSTPNKPPGSLKIPLNNKTKLQKSIVTSTPKGAKSAGSGGKQGGPENGGLGSGRNLVPMKCKICNTCFRYRRCLFRHLRENHPGIDQDNLMQYIDMDASSISSPSSSTPSGAKRELSGGKGTSPQQPRGPQDAVDASTTSSSLHVTIGSEVGELSDSAAASLLTGDGNVTGNESEILLMSQGRLEVPRSEPSSDEEDDELDTAGDESGVAAETKTDRGRTSKSRAPGKFNCTVCSKTFDRPYRLQRHLQIHNPNRPRVQCQFCDRSFTRIDTLENHVKCLHSNERPYKCTFEGCDKTFPLNSALVHHMKSHMGGKPYQCGECDLSFALLGEFKVHVNEAHPFTKDRRCSDCFKIFPTTDELEQHYALEHRYECEICRKSFARLGYLQAHIEIHNGVSMYNCRQCNAGFDSEYSYKQHIRTHPNYNKAKRVYPCHICGKTFYESRKMILHSHSDEHQEKAKSLGLPAGVVLQNLTAEEADVSILVNEVANSMQASGSTGTPSVDDNLIQSIVESEAFKAAAASVGVATNAATGEDSLSSSSPPSSLLNNGGTTAVAVSDAANAMLNRMARTGGGVAGQSTNMVATTEQ